jgi:hypothetical protein
MMTTGFIGLGDMGADVHPAGPNAQLRDIISRMSNPRFTELLTDGCNYTLTGGITFMVGTLTAEVNGGLR